MVDTSDNLRRAYTNLKDCCAGYEEGLLPYAVVIEARTILQDAAEAYDEDHSVNTATECLAEGLADSKRLS